MNGNWRCESNVNYELVQVHSDGSGDAVRLSAGCTGRIGRLEVDGVRNGDGIKVQNSGNVAHDLTIESGFVSCVGPSTDGTHQDGLQAMGGTNITFRRFVFDCYGGGGGNYFVQRAGGGATTPTNIVCDGCAFGPRHPNNVNLGNSVGSGARNSLICEPTSGRNPFMTDSGAPQPGQESRSPRGEIPTHVISLRAEREAAPDQISTVAVLAMLVLASLTGMKHEVVVPEDVRLRALRSLERMLSIGRPSGD